MRFDASGCPPPRPLRPRLRPLRPRLRSFPSAAPLRPPLRSLFSYSEGWRGAVDGKRRSRRGSALLWSAERSAGTIGGAVRSADEAGSSGCAGWLAAHRACPVESLAGWSSGSVLAGAPELRHRPRARRGGSADPIGFRFWRSGRIVPPRTPPHRRRNRGIMRKSLSASGVPARTILPERHIPPRAGSAGAVFSASSGRATPVEAPAAAMLRAAPGAPDRRPPPPRSGVSTGREDRAGKGGWRITFGCVGGAAHPGNGVIAPLRDGRGAGRRVKDMRRPPF